MTEHQPMSPFEVFYDVDEESYYIFAPTGCVLVNGVAATIKDKDSYDNVALDLDAEDMPDALYAHVSAASAGYEVEFDDEETKDGATWNFKVVNFGEDDFDGKQYQLVTSVMSLGGSGGFPGCYELTITQNDDQTYSGTFANQYYRVAGKTYTTSFSSATLTNGILCLEIDATGSQPSASMATYSDLASLQNAEQDLSKFVCPLYTISNYAIACDWRKGALITMTEF